MLNYLGKLPQEDPLYNYLKYEIFPRLGCRCCKGFRVFGTRCSNSVYIYEERATGTRAVGKFFYSPRQLDWDAAWRRLDREHRNAIEISNYLGGTHYAARVLGRNDDMNRLLVVEYCYGTPLDEIISRAIKENVPQLLYDKLRALAWFLATLHNRSARQHGPVRFDAVCRYFDSVINRLKTIISPHDEWRLRKFCEDYRRTPAMWQDREVLVHGDATPSNFFFGDGMHVITFDFERSQRTDRLFDVGRLCAELQHFFLRMTGNKFAAEPFIGHFLWEYCCHFPDREKTFESISRKIPFYMGMNLLRIARNNYLDNDYRHRLILEAGECLRRK